MKNDIGSNKIKDMWKKYQIKESKDCGGQRHEYRCNCSCKNE